MMASGATLTPLTESLAPRSTDARAAHSKTNQLPRVGSGATEWWTQQRLPMSSVCSHAPTYGYKGQPKKAGPRRSRPAIVAPRRAWRVR